VQANPTAFDLILTDLSMPQMSGGELATRILAIRPDVPIVAMSGSSQDVRLDTIKSLGVREYIMKPFSLSDLAHVVREVLDEP
jgi:CheY-like chemotaxis protein